MAKLPAIIDLIARHDTRSVATITNYARVLREAGYLPKGKRGRGAPDLDPQEVADLVIGLAGASDAVEAPHAVEVLTKAKLGPNARIDREGLLPVDEELAQWSISDKAESFGMLLASLLVDEPMRQDNPGDLPGVTNMSVTIHEVVRGAIFGSAQVYLDDGNRNGVEFGFLSHCDDDLEKDLADYDPDAFARTAWRRSTAIDYSFFAEMSWLLNGVRPGEET